MVDLGGIEPTTSSMPWNEENAKLLTLQDVIVGLGAKNRVNRRNLRPNCAQKLTSGSRAGRWGIGPSLTFPHARPVPSYHRLALLRLILPAKYRSEKTFGNLDVSFNITYCGQR